MAKSTIGVAGALALVLSSGSGCGSDQGSPVPDLAAADSAPQPQHRAHKPRPGKPRAAPRGRQLLFAVPKMGRLFASCGSDTAFRLTYTANRDQGEHVVVSVGKVVVKRQDLDPSRSLSFSVKVTPKPMGSSVVHESPAVELTASVNGEPFDGRSVERFKLANAADQTGECVAESAVVRVATHFHFG